MPEKDIKFFIKAIIKRDIVWYTKRKASVFRADEIRLKRKKKESFFGSGYFAQNEKGSRNRGSCVEIA